MAAQQPQLPQLPQQLPVPNIANIQAAVNGMTAERNTIALSAQAYDAHQQQFTKELSLCANYPVVQILHQLNTLTQLVTNMDARIDAQFWNIRAQMQNSRIFNATGQLVGMQSIERGPNPQVPIGHAIPNFPNTPDQITQMSAPQCRTVLRSLGIPAPQGNQVGTRRQLRTAVREAVGLPAL